LPATQLEARRSIRQHQAGHAAWGRQRQFHRHGPAHGQPDHVGPPDIQRVEQPRRIARMLRDGERLLALAVAEAAQVGHDHTVVSRKHRYLPSPVVVAAAEAMQQQHRRPLSFHLAGQADPVDDPMFHICHPR
jgi:hypothetical protein